MLGERLWKLRWSASSVVWEAMLKGWFSLEVSSTPDLAMSCISVMLTQLIVLMVTSLT